MKKERLVQ